MKNCNYLYGVDKATWHHLVYDDALKLKNKLAKELLDSLYNVYYLDRDAQRINDVVRAISFNERLLGE